MQDFLHVKEGGEIYQVFFSQMQYIESRHKYVRIVTTDREYVTRDSIRRVASKLPADQFCRIHRSFIVSFRYARHLNRRVVMVEGTQLPIGRRYRGLLWSKLLMTCSGMTLTKTAIKKLFNPPKKG